MRPFAAAWTDPELVQWCVAQLLWRQIIVLLEKLKVPKDRLWYSATRAIETAKVIEALIAMVKSFNEAANRGEDLGLTPQEMAFYDALETNEASVRVLGDVVVKEIARLLTDYLRNHLTVDWSVRGAVRANMRVQIKLILRRHKYPPDMEARAVELVLKQAEALSEAWTG